jgi:hypothetical protein
VIQVVPLGDWSAFTLSLSVVKGRPGAIFLSELMAHFVGPRQSRSTAMTQVHDERSSTVAVRFTIFAGVAMIMIGLVHALRGDRSAPLRVGAD